MCERHSDGGDRLLQQTSKRRARGRGIAATNIFVCSSGRVIKSFSHPRVAIPREHENRAGREERATSKRDSHFNDSS